jgi:O-antigen/teichoic acid export membrane protein
MIRSIPDASFSVEIGFDRKTIIDGLFHLPGIYYLGNLLSLTYLATYVMSPGEAGVYYVGYRAAAATYVLVSAGFEAVLASSVAGGRRPSGLGGWFVIYGVIALLLLYVAAPLVSVVFGEAFSGSVRPIRLLASCVPTFALCGLGHTLLMAARYERFGTYVLVALLAGGFGLALSGEFLFGPEITALVPATSSFIAMTVLWAGLSRFVTRDAP